MQFKNKELFSFINKNLHKKTKYLFLLLIFFSIVIGAIDLISIYLLQNVNIYIETDNQSNHKYVVLFLINFTFLFFIKLFHIILNRYLLISVETNFSNIIVKKNLKSKFIDSNSYNNSAIVNLVSYESKRISYQVIKPISNALSSIIILMIIILGLSIFGYSKTIIIGGIASALLILLYLIYKKKFQTFNINLTKKNKERTKSLLETLDGNVFIRTFKLENFFESQFVKINNSLKKTYFFSEIYQNIPIKFVELLIIFILFLSYLFSYYYNLDFIRIDFLVYFYAFYRTYPTLKEIFSSFANFQNNKESFEQIKNYLNENYEIYQERKIHKLKSFKNIYFNNLTIKRGNKLLINNLNIKISNNKVLGISGSSGKGKTTLAYAISGLIDTLSSDIYIDDKPLDKIDLLNLRRQILYLSENPFIISANLKDNLFINYSKNELISLLEIVNFENINENYQIDRDQNNISYGQKQKIALIRAILHKPSVIILDEALNGIDLKTMDKIFKYLIKRKFTIILITHNTNVLKKYCHKIIYL